MVVPQTLSCFEQNRFEEQNTVTLLAVTTVSRRATSPCPGNCVCCPCPQYRGPLVTRCAPRQLPPTQARNGQALNSRGRTVAHTPPLPHHCITTVYPGTTTWLYLRSPSSTSAISLAAPANQSSNFATASSQTAVKIQKGAKQP